MTKLTVIIPTSMRKDNPETTHIEYTLNSLSDIKARKIIVCDGFSERAGAQDKYSIENHGRMDPELYSQYKKNIQGLGVEVVELPDHGGLNGVVCYGMDIANTDVVLIYQHDFLLLNVPDLDFIVWEMGRRDKVKHLRLNKRSNVIAGYDYILMEDPNIPFPALKTSAWSDNPHFITKNYFEEIVRPAIKNIKSYPECTLMEMYARSITRDEFTVAHQKFGTYLYGTFDEGPYVRHIG